MGVPPGFHEVLFIIQLNLSNTDTEVTKQIPSVLERYPYYRGHEYDVTLKGLGHAMYCNFITFKLVIELNEAPK